MKLLLIAIVLNIFVGDLNKINRVNRAKRAAEEAYKNEDFETAFNDLNAGRSFDIIQASEINFG